MEKLPDSIHEVNYEANQLFQLCTTYVLTLAGIADYQRTNIKYGIK